MSSELPDTPETTSGWQPPADLREPLRWGFLGAIAAGGLAIATSLAALLEVPGIERWSDTLALIGILPQIAVLVALVRIGQASAASDPSWDPLARAAGAAFGLLWLVTVLSFTMDFVGDREWPLFILSLVAGAALLGLIALGVPEAAVPVGLLTFFGVRFGLGFLLIGRKLPSDAAIALTAILLMVVGGLVFPVWLVVVLWGRRHKLGSAAGVLAAGVALGLVGFLSVVGWLAYTAATTPNLMARVDEFETLFKPHVRVGLLVSLLADGVAALAAALLFRGITARLPDGLLAEDTGPATLPHGGETTGPERDF